MIEIEGDLHAAPDEAAQDAARPAWLVERGYNAIRFQSVEVERDPEGVLCRIMEACENRAAR